MAHEITRTDNIVLAGNRSAWHGLGRLVAHAPNAYEAIHLAGIGWIAQEWDLSAQRLTPEGFETIEVRERKAIVRSDTRALLGVVGKDYTPLQQGELAKVIDDLGREGHCPRIESAGSLRGGREVFFLARAGSFFADDDGRDEVHQYLLFANGHDGSRSLSVTPTTIRVVCNNTLTAALGSSAVRRVRHTLNARTELSRLGDSILTAIKAHGQFSEACRALAKRELSRDEVVAFFGRVYHASSGMVPGSKVSQKHAETQLRAWQHALEADPTNAMCGRTAWAALNVITQWADHTRPTRVERTYSKLMGPAAAIKESALGAALATL